ncbi:BnaA02g07160D [Brassica napus]|uniref:BnaA02g07160D protein n=2 Tax=Brassica TaxID=3705 RepID=A0A078H5D0_BRANA|nr:BnaA02g07160D [Brassica napus]
MYKHKKCKHSY